MPALRVDPERLEQVIWSVDTFTELCDRYRQEHALPFGIAYDADGRIQAATLEDAARQLGVLAHAARGTRAGLDAAVVQALDDRDIAVERAGAPGSARWDALFDRAGVSGGRVTDHAKNVQFRYRLQLGVVRIFCRSASLDEWLDGVAPSLDAIARGADPCPCGCEAS